MVDTVDAPASGPGVGTQILAWIQMIVLCVVVPIVVYDVLTDRGVGPTLALAVGSVGPLLDIAITYLVHRRLDEFAVLVLVFLVIGVVAGLLFADPRLLLLKESAVTGLLGLVMLASLVVMPRPLMFYLGRRFATGGAPHRIEWWNGLWRFEGFRRTQRVITTVWGVVFLAEAVARGVLTYVLPIDTMVVVNNVAPPVVIGVLVVWTTVYARRAQRRGEARRGLDLGAPA